MLSYISQTHQSNDNLLGKREQWSEEEAKHSLVKSSPREHTAEKQNALLVPQHIA